MPEDNRKKILIIEDNIAVSEEVATLLRFEEYDVIEARNGLDGISIAEHQLPDLILCDVRLSGELNGFDVFTQLRKNPVTSHIRFIFQTGLPSEEFIKSISDFEFTGYLRKPFEAEEIISLLEKILK
jgi:CheY-like chemotaxis protein